MDSIEEEMKHVPKRRIQEIMNRIDCPQGFSCYKSEFKNLCRQQITEYEKLLQCAEDKCTNGDRRSCKMIASWGDKNCCRCPLRIYVATYLNNLAALEGPISEMPSDDDQ